MVRKIQPLIIQMVRHAESAANAGAATDDPAEIPLTEYGLKQAEALSLSFTQAPTAIVCSPFLRARQTAAPTAKRFNLPLEIWPVQEFTYLSPARCVNTTQDQRRAWVESFWKEAHPDTVDGPGAESFAQFISRVEDTLVKLEVFQADERVLVFCHAQFMQAMRWLIECRPLPLVKSHLQELRQRDLTEPIKNCQGYRLMRINDEWRL